MVYETIEVLPPLWAHFFHFPGSTHPGLISIPPIYQTCYHLRTISICSLHLEHTTLILLLDRLLLLSHVFIQSHSLEGSSSTTFKNSYLPTPVNLYFITEHLKSSLSLSLSLSLSVSLSLSLFLSLSLLQVYFLSPSTGLQVSTRQGPTPPLLYSSTQNSAWPNTGLLTACLSDEDIVPSTQQALSICSLSYHHSAPFNSLFVGLLHILGLISLTFIQQHQ